jgi:uncharacterized NAD(P)/FAD-binding protein YdhS
MSEVEIAFKTYEITSIIAAIIGSVFTGLMVFNALVNNPRFKALEEKVIAFETKHNRYDEDIRSLRESMIKVDGTLNVIQQGVSDLKEQFQKFLDREERKREREEDKHP